MAGENGLKNDPIENGPVQWSHGGSKQSLQLNCKNRSGGRKTQSCVLNFYVGIEHYILRETKTRRIKIYLPAQIGEY